MFDKLLRRFGASKNVETAQAMAALLVGMLPGDADAKEIRLGMDNRAQTSNSAMKAVSLVVGLTVGGIVAAFLLPIAIDELVGVDTSSWSSGASSLWAIMDVIVVLALFLFFIGVALAAANKV